jgi:hypothetical protein
LKKYLLIIFVILFNSFLRSQTVCVNTNFESTSAGAYTASNSVSAWIVSSQSVTGCSTSTVWTPGSSEFSIVSTPQGSLPYIGTLGNSPLGGTVVARLNNQTANNYSTRLTQTLQVTNANPLFQYAFAGIWQGGGHSCCEQAGYKISLKDAQGIPLLCTTQSLTPNGSGCTGSASGYSVTSGNLWTNWQVRFVDLSAYTGSVITLEIIVNDCAYGDHYGTLFFDAKCPQAFNDPCLCVTSNFSVPKVSFCPGSNYASISGPLGYSSYFWIAPSGSPSLTPSQSTLASITITNPVQGSTYTVNLITASGCMITQTATLNTTTLTLLGLGSTTTCTGGTSGSATVLASGSASGYNYSWTNSSSSVVATTSVAGNLPAGIYSVVVTAINSVSCGVVTTTVAITSATPGVTNLIKPYCGTQAYLNPPSGTNYQWYGPNLSAITGSAGAASAYTVNSPSNMQNYYVRFTSSQNCQDSIKYTLVATPPGSLSIPASGISTICPGATNGTATIYMTPSPGSPPGYNSYSVSSTGTANSYSVASTPGASTTYTLGFLSPGIYSVNAFDGACKYTTTFTVNTFNFNYSLTPVSSTVCSGNSMPASITFTSPPSSGQYTYSWTPTTWLMGGSGNLPNTIITPSSSPGNSATIIYTVVVTPSVANCPLTKTLSVTSVNLLTPTISTIPSMCSNGSTFAIIANPPGGSFQNAPGAGQPINITTGILTPSLAVPGLNTFTYTISQYTCTKNTTSSYSIISGPLMVITGPTEICSGQGAILNVSGANTYSWSTGINTPSIQLSPLSTITLSVLGTNSSSCSAVIFHTLQVTTMPTVSIAGNNTICSGQSTTLTASGAATYSWSNGATGNINSIIPLASAVYSVIGYNSFLCKDTSFVQVNVITTPTLNVTGNFSICAGETTLLKATGATTYSWSNNSTNANVSVKPLNTATYTVVGKNGQCVGSKSVTVTVSPCTHLSTDEKEPEITIYPNPSSEYIVIESNAWHMVTIYDVTGKQVRKFEISRGKNKLALDGIENGMYVFVLDEEHNGPTYKFIKQAGK